MSQQQSTLSGVLVAIVAPLMGAVILTLGNGYFATITTLEMKKFHTPVVLIGLMAATYFAGIMIGSYESQRWINRIGHIRSYAAFAAIMAVTSLIQGMDFNMWSWGICRFFYGYALAGLYLVVEAWLLSVSGVAYKGRVFAIYLTAFYISTALGQLGLLLPLHGFLMIFNLIGLFAALSILPVCMTRVAAPEIDQPVIMSPLAILKKAPLGVITCLVAGGVIGVVYSMLPLFYAQAGIHEDTIAWMMLVTILGAAAFQLPVGRYSDRVDRRLVLGAMCLATGGSALLIVFFHHSIYMLYILSFIFGGFAFTINPLGIAHASDYLDPKLLITGISTLVLMYGLGSAVGPLVVSAFMHSFGPYGFFVYMVLVSFPLGLYSFWRVTRRGASSDGQFTPNATVGPVPVERLGEILSTDEEIATDEGH